LRKGYIAIALVIKNTLYSLKNPREKLKGKELNEIMEKVFAEAYNMLNSKQKERLWVKIPKELEILQEVIENAFVR